MIVDQEHEQVARAWGAPEELGSAPAPAAMPESDSMGIGSIAGAGARAKGTPLTPAAPQTPDALVGPAAWATGQPEADVGTVGEVLRTAWLRIQARQQLREFLRAVPRREAEVTLTLVRADGSTRLIQRAELSTAIDRLRPRQRQIVRLSIEERWPRQRVCEYLRHISIKTLERDQMEALDRLAEL
jgi:hypothetical protein